MASNDHTRLLQELYPDLIPILDYELDRDVVLSFPDVQRNTLKTLYNYNDATSTAHSQDKSPKGSVDVTIRPLVDLINCHPSFSTLSSCSGRITLFDPKLLAASATSDNEILQTPSVSGKGFGGWLLSSHELVDPNILSTLMPDDDTDSKETNHLVFKFEPLLLHVAASTLPRARQLLSLALALGFRESGLMLSNAKVTVAIRGTSLALAVPLAPCGPLRPPNSYLQALVQDANKRLQTNLDKLKRLHSTVQESLFRPKQRQDSGTYSCTFDSLPCLNLWGHAAVALCNDSNNGVDVFVFGGYGSGPQVVESETCNSTSTTSCQRSRHVYRLSRRDGTWEQAWTRVTLTDATRGSDTTAHGIETTNVEFTPREGHDALAIYPSNNGAALVVIWGGRTSPAKPCSNDLLLFNPTTGAFATPNKVHGELPSPRWGHKLTPLPSNSDNSCVAVLTGGRTTDQCCSDAVHVLSLIKSHESSNHFAWEQILCNNDCFMPRFHHSVVFHRDSSSLVIFGGLSNPNNLIEPFSLDDSHGIIESVSAYHLDLEDKTMDKDIKEVPTVMPCLFGASAAWFRNEGLLVVSGGVHGSMEDLADDSTGSSLHFYYYIIKDKGQDLRLIPVEISSFASSDNNCILNLGSMVHHTALSVASREGYSELLLLGGGVLAFAFGPTFAENYRIQLVPDTYESASLSYSARAVKKSTSPSPCTISKPEATPQSSSGAVVTDVLYVLPKHAKLVKTSLEELGYLNKTYRMRTAKNETEKQIAIPVSEECLQQLESSSPNNMSWQPFVIETGQQQMPYSTVVMGRQAQRNK